MSWVRNLGWVKTLGLVVGAVLLALAAGRAQSLRAAAQRKDDRAVGLLNSNISKELHAGQKLIESAHKDKDKAVEAQRLMEHRLEKLGEANEDLDSIADRFNSRRLRTAVNGNNT